MEDFHEAGGVEAVMRSLSAQIDLGTYDITGTTLAERLSRPPMIARDDRFIRPFDRPINAEGGLIIVSGSLAPDGAESPR